MLLPWFTVVFLSSSGELLLCLVLSTGSYYVYVNVCLAHPSILLNVGTCAKLSIQGNVILQILFSFQNKFQFTYLNT